MDKKILLFALFLLIIPFASSSFTLNPSYINVTTNVNQLTLVNIQVTNTFNFTMYNVTASAVPYTTFTKINQLAPSETLTMEARIQTDHTFDETYSSKLNGYYYSAIIPEPQIYNISVDDYGFHPSYLTIRQGDTVVWFNNGTVTHSITSALWEYDIPVGSSQPITITQLGDLVYHDRITMIYATLHVISPTTQQLTFNDAYGFPLSVHIVSKLAQTSINMDILDSNFTVVYGETEEGILKITNVGNSTAYGLSLSSDWCSFDEDNFTLNPSDYNYVTFHVFPYVFSTDETNREHQVPITLKGSNIADLTKYITVFVPYYEFTGEENETGWWEAKLRFCTNFPNSSLCLTEPIKEYINQTIYRESEVPYNYSQSDLHEMFLEAQRNKDNINALKTLADTSATKQSDMESALNTMYQLVNQTLTKVTDMETSQKNRFVITWLIFTIGSIGFMFFYSKSKLEKLKKQRDITKMMGYSPKKKDE